MESLFFSKKLALNIVTSFICEMKSIHTKANILFTQVSVVCLLIVSAGVSAQATSHNSSTACAGTASPQSCTIKDPGDPEVTYTWSSPANMACNNSANKMLGTGAGNYVAPSLGPVCSNAIYSVPPTNKCKDLIAPVLPCGQPTASEAPGAE